MRMIFLIFSGLITVNSAGVSEAANQSDGCNSSVSRDEFESHGGKLVMSRPPDMRFPRNISTICRGAAGLGITILPNGTVRTEDFEHNYFSSPGDTFETSGRTIGVCDRLM